MNKRFTAALLGIVSLFFIILSLFLLNEITSQSSDFTMNDGRQAPRMNMNQQMRMGQVEEAPLVVSNEKERPLNIPPLLEPHESVGNHISYSLVADESNSQLKSGQTTQTAGYNGSFLGPVIHLRDGQEVHIEAKNNLNEPTSFHWHGLKVPSDVDGGPHTPIQPGETMDLDFSVNQEATTLWFHPHPEGNAGKQVYSGLAGLIYIEDDHSDGLALPKDYGVNDFPVIIQDRFFDEDNQLNYEAFYHPDGLYGDTLLINGTINPYIDVKNDYIRLRLLNGSNARNYQLQLSNQAKFYQIASDGGFLNEPLALKTLQLVPGERAEIIVDLTDYAAGGHVQLIEENVPVLTLRVSENTEEEPPPLPTTLNNIPQSETTNQTPDKSLTFSGMGQMVTIDGKKFDMDRVDLHAKVGEKEIWTIENIPHMMGSMIHPFHLHGVQFRVLTRNGLTPPAYERGWKDTIALYPGETVQIEVEFPEKGIFMYHCHILEHEDNGMMGQVLVE